MLSSLTRHPPLMRAALINTHVVHAIHHLRLPCRVQRESIMSKETTVNETMMNETMLKTADRMSDTNECVPCRTHKHAAKCQYSQWLLARACRENAMQETKDAMSNDP